WLARYQYEKNEIWLVIRRNAPQNGWITVTEAREEAICFGWVDSFLKPLDSEGYALRFSPRRRGSAWGRANKARALKMMREGKMTPSGMVTLPEDVLRQWERENTSYFP
ncbi:MAG: hypothetical protein AAGU05_17500, partial [Anaerolineaceae bacterium]